MIGTLTNTSGGTLNALDVHDGGSGAVGGQRKDPLPHPYGDIGSLADSGTSIRSIFQADYRYKRVPWLTFEARDELNMMVQAGKITLAVATDAQVRDVEELQKDTI